MLARSICGVVLICWTAHAVIVDRVAIVMGKKIVKDSDIVQDLRLTAFLNQETPAYTAAARKKSAERLVEQTLIREEVESGDYPRATIAQTQGTLESLVKSRYRTDSAYHGDLARYGITEQELKHRLLWQLTVLRFVDARFLGRRRTSRIDDVKQYYDAHKQQFGESLDASRAKIQETSGGRKDEQSILRMARSSQTICGNPVFGGRA